MTSEDESIESTPIETPGRVILRRVLTVGVFVLAAIAFFLSYRLLNDHFDRLARARQIAVFGEVPFRDFFDPGYFLTLYVSALIQRVFGDNLLGELILNVIFMAAGTTLVFLMASRVSGSWFWGAIAAAMVIVGMPRAYDYDKILFFPLGLYACWRYVDRPTIGSLWFLSLTVAIAALFRYDSGVYLGVPALVAIIVRHWGTWSIAARRAATAGLIMMLGVSPAIAFVQRTAGLKDAYEQISLYAKSEGSRGHIFEPQAFNIDRTAPLVVKTPENSPPDLFQDVWWLPGYLTRGNAGTWLYYMATALPLAVGALVVLLGGDRRRTTLARLLSFCTLAILVGMFILRIPITARIGGVIPLMGISGGYLIGILRSRPRAIERAPLAVKAASPARRATRGLIAAVGLLLAVVTAISMAILVEVPSAANLDVSVRLAQFSEAPPSLDLWPHSALLPLVEYLRACTKPNDRILAGWFIGEIYVFTGRGFAAGLPVVFGDHWTELEYQRRSLRLIEQQSVPIIVTPPGEDMHNYRFLRDFIRKRYQPVPDNRDVPHVQLWIRGGLPVVRRYGESGIPCYAE